LEKIGTSLSDPDKSDVLGGKMRIFGKVERKWGKNPQNAKEKPNFGTEAPKVYF